MSKIQGRANITLGGEQTLTEYNGNAVVGLGQSGEWKTRLYGDSKTPKFLFIFNSGESGTTYTESVLTLDETSDSPDSINISISQLESPPSNNQLWTLEEAVEKESLPPIVLARIQSVAKPDYSAAIGGHIPLPRIYLNVAAVPNQPGSESQRWSLDYLEIEN